jgi:hypothetical protein
MALFSVSDQWITTKQLATFLNIHDVTIRKQLSKADVAADGTVMIFATITAKKFGGEWRFNASQYALREKGLKP